MDQTSARSPSNSSDSLTLSKEERKRVLGRLNIKKKGSSSSSSSSRPSESSSLEKETDGDDERDTKQNKTAKTKKRTQSDRNKRYMTSPREYKQLSAPPSSSSSRSKQQQQEDLSNDSKLEILKSSLEGKLPKSKDTTSSSLLSDGIENYKQGSPLTSPSTSSLSLKLLDDFKRSDTSTVNSTASTSTGKLSQQQQLSHEQTIKVIKTTTDYIDYITTVFSNLSIDKMLEDSTFIDDICVAISKDWVSGRLFNLCRLLSCDTYPGLSVIVPSGTMDETKALGVDSIIRILIRECLIVISTVFSKNFISIMTQKISEPILMVSSYVDDMSIISKFTESQRLSVIEELNKSSVEWRRYIKSLIKYHAFVTLPNSAHCIITDLCSSHETITPDAIREFLKRNAELLNSINADYQKSSSSSSSYYSRFSQNSNKSVSNGVAKLPNSDKNIKHLKKVLNATHKLYLSNEFRRLYDKIKSVNKKPTGMSDEDFSKLSPSSTKNFEYVSYMFPSFINALEVPTHSFVELLKDDEDSSEGDETGITTSANAEFDSTGVSGKGDTLIKKKPSISPLRKRMNKSDEDAIDSDGNKLPHRKYKPSISLATPTTTTSVASAASNSSSSSSSSPSESPQVSPRTKIHKFKLPIAIKNVFIIADRQVSEDFEKQQGSGNSEFDFVFGVTVPSLIKKLELSVAGNNSIDIALESVTDKLFTKYNELDSTKYIQRNSVPTDFVENKYLGESPVMESVIESDLFTGNSISSGDDDSNATYDSILSKDAMELLLENRDDLKFGLCAGMNPTFLQSLRLGIIPSQVGEKALLYSMNDGKGFSPNSIKILLNTVSVILNEIKEDQEDLSAVPGTGLDKEDVLLSTNSFGSFYESYSCYYNIGGFMSKLGPMGASSLLFRSNQASKLDLKHLSNIMQQQKKLESQEDEEEEGSEDTRYFDEDDTHDENGAKLTISPNLSLRERKALLLREFRTDITTTQIARQSKQNALMFGVSKFIADFQTHEMYPKLILALVNLSNDSNDKMNVSRVNIILTNVLNSLKEHENFDDFFGFIKLGEEDERESTLLLNRPIRPELSKVFKVPSVVLDSDVFDKSLEDLFNVHSARSLGSNSETKKDKKRSDKKKKKRQSNDSSFDDTLLLDSTAYRPLYEVIINYNTRNTSSPKAASASAAPVPSNLGSDSGYVSSYGASRRFGRDASASSSSSPGVVDPTLNVFYKYATNATDKLFKEFRELLSSSTSGTTASAAAAAASAASKNKILIKNSFDWKEFRPVNSSTLDRENISIIEGQFKTMVKYLIERVVPLCSLNLAPDYYSYGVIGGGSGGNTRDIGLLPGGVNTINNLRFLITQCRDESLPLITTVFDITNVDQRKLYCWFIAEILRVVVAFNLFSLLDADKLIAISQTPSRPGSSTEKTFGECIIEYFGQLDKTYKSKELLMDAFYVNSDPFKEFTSNLESDGEIIEYLEFLDILEAICDEKRFMWSSGSPLRFKHYIDTTGGMKKMASTAALFGITLHNYLYSDTGKKDDTTKDDSSSSSSSSGKKGDNTSTASQKPKQELDSSSNSVIKDSVLTEVINETKDLSSKEIVLDVATKLEQTSNTTAAFYASSKEKFEEYFSDTLSGNFKGYTKDADSTGSQDVFSKGYPDIVKYINSIIFDTQAATTTSTKNVNPLTKVSEDGITLFYTTEDALLKNLQLILPSINTESRKKIIMGFIKIQSKILELASVTSSVPQLKEETNTILSVLKEQKKSSETVTSILNFVLDGLDAASKKFDSKIEAINKAIQDSVKKSESVANAAAAALEAAGATATPPLSKTGKDFVAFLNNVNPELINNLRTGMKRNDPSVTQNLVMMILKFTGYSTIELSTNASKIISLLKEAGLQAPMLETVLGCSTFAFNSLLITYSFWAGFKSWYNKPDTIVLTGPDASNINLSEMESVILNNERMRFVMESEDSGELIKLLKRFSSDSHDGGIDNPNNNTEVSIDLLKARVGYIKDILTKTRSGKYRALLLNKAIRRTNVGWLEYYQQSTSFFAKLSLRTLIAGVSLKAPSLMTTYLLPHTTTLSTRLSDSVLLCLVMTVSLFFVLKWILGKISGLTTKYLMPNDGPLMKLENVLDSTINLNTLGVDKLSKYKKQA